MDTRLNIINIINLDGELAYQGWRPLSPDLMPRDDRFNDRALVTANIGSYQPNAWGLYDMHGNAAEWTRSVYKPYPYSNDNSDAANNKERIVHGGSWRDRPWRCRLSFRLNYPSYQPVFNVGFRVILEGDETIKTAQISQKGEKKP